MRDPGSLDRRAQILRAGLVNDGYQRRAGAFEPHGGSIWAARNFISDRERYAAGAVGVDAVARFTVRWSKFSAGITHQDRLVCDGQVYGITGLKEIGRRQWVEITCQRVEHG